MTSSDSNNPRDWDGESGPPNRTDDYEDALLLRPIFDALWSYRRVILLSVGALVAVLSVRAFWVYVSQAEEQLASLEFRLTFDGAERGQYPNGLDFDRAEITAPPILAEVYAANNLDRYCSYETFENGFIVRDTGTPLDLLDYEYRTLLADADLSLVDRLKFEDEFIQKRDALRGQQYSLNLFGSGEILGIPETLTNKVLNDVLAAWSEQAITQKGVFLYQTDLYTPNSFLTEFEELREHNGVLDDPVLEVELLRIRVERILDNLEELSTLPGAATMRVGEERVSLGEIRANLNDLLTFRLEPLASYIWTNGLIRDQAAFEAFVETRQFQISLDLENLEGQRQVTEDSLRLFLGGDRLARDSSSRVTGPDTPQTFVPQFGDSFIDRIIGMAEETKADTFAYRELVVNRLASIGVEMLDLAQQAAHYERMKEMVGRARPVAGLRSTGGAATEIISTDFAEIYGAVIETVDQTNVVYEELSARNLQPQAGLFEISGPFTMTTDRSIDLGLLAQRSALYAMIGLLLLPVFCLAHKYYWL